MKNCFSYWGSAISYIPQHMEMIEPVTEISPLVNLIDKLAKYHVNGVERWYERVCIISPCSAHAFGGHIPRLGVGIFSPTVSHTLLTGGPLFLVKAVIQLCSPQWGFLHPRSPNTPLYQPTWSRVSVMDFTEWMFVEFHNCAIVRKYMITILSPHADASETSISLQLWRNYSSRAQWPRERLWHPLQYICKDKGEKMCLNFKRLVIFSF